MDMPCILHDLVKSFRSGPQLALLESPTMCHCIIRRDTNGKQSPVCGCYEVEKCVCCDNSEGVHTVLV